MRRLKQKRNHPKQQLKGCQINVADLPQSDIHKHHVSDHPTDNTEKLMVPTMTPQTTTPETLRGAGVHNCNQRKSLLPPIGTGLDNHCKKTKTTIWIYCRPQ